jgi:aldehyde dehydrogenase (NAD+)
VVSHWTFPLAACAWSVSAALAAGNTVVLKPSEDAPLIAVRFVEMLFETGLPAGVLSLVHGYGEEAGAPLVRHPDIDFVSFTGSSEVGREVSIACAAERKALTLDVGERSVAMVLDDADLNLAAESIIGGGLAFSGQRWRGTTRVFAHRKVAKECAERLVARAQSLRLGDGLSAATDVGPLINESQLKRAHSLTRSGIREGAKLLCGGEIVREGDCRRGYFYAPTVFGEATVKMRIVQEEVLGPTCVVLPVASLDEAIDQAAIPRRDGTALVFTRDLARGLRAAEGLRAGRILVNPAPPDPGTPFPWTGFSRLGRIRGRGVSSEFEALSTWKEAVVDLLGKRQPL